MKKKVRKRLWVLALVAFFVFFFSTMWYEGVYRVEKLKEEEIRIYIDSLKKATKKQEVSKFRTQYPNYLPCRERPRHFHVKRRT